MNTIAGYQFAITDNTVYLPSAVGAQNEIPEPTIAACREDLNNEDDAPIKGGG